MYIGIPQNLILNNRYAFNNRVDGIGSFLRVGFVFEQQVSLELDEIGLMGLDIFAELVGRVRACKLVRVLAFG